MIKSNNSFSLTLLYRWMFLFNLEKVLNEKKKKKNGLLRWARYSIYINCTLRSVKYCRCNYKISTTQNWNPQGILLKTGKITIHITVVFLLHNLLYATENFFWLKNSWKIGSIIKFNWYLCVFKRVIKYLSLILYFPFRFFNFLYLCVRNITLVSCVAQQFKSLTRLWTKKNVVI